MKQQIKIKLYLENPNTVVHVNIADPAKGRKLNYEELEDRKQTYKLPPQWDRPVGYQPMAEAGFVYTGQEDLVYCFSCNIKLDRWSKDMEPLLRHKEESPTCSFMRQKLQAVKKGKTKSVVAPSKPLNSRLTSSIGQLQSSSLVTSKAIHAVVTGLNEPRLSYGGSFDDRSRAFLPITPENYQSEAERIKSFVGWPLNEAVHPEQLARVGFVYTGEGALVQCFQCGVKYRHWYKGDVPLHVHQKCNPRCPFLQILTSKSKSTPPEQRPTRSYVQLESIGGNTQGEEVSKYSLQFPDYSDEAVRLQSFKHWGGRKKQLTSENLDMMYPLSLKSKDASEPDVFNNPARIPGMHYPPSWWSNPPRALSEDDSDETFHSAELRNKNDYSVLTSIDPPKTKIMVRKLYEYTII